MSGKRKSTRGSGRVSYAEPVGDDVSDADEAFDEGEFPSQLLRWCQPDLIVISPGRNKGKETQDCTKGACKGQA